MNPRNFLFAFAAVVAALTSTGVAVGPAIAQTANASVGYADLNLNSPQGVARLNQRIVQAAELACGPASDRNLVAIRSARACRANALSSATAQLQAIAS